MAPLALDGGVDGRVNQMNVAASDMAETRLTRPLISGHCPLVVDKGRVVIGGWEDLDTRQGVRRRE